MQPNAFRDKTDYEVKKRPPWVEYKLHIVVFVLVVISSWIGIKEFKITETISILFLPLIYALILGLGLYLAKPIKFVGPKQSKVAEGVMVLFIGVLIAKLAVSSGYEIATIFSVGYALILQQLGNLGTLLALPVALLLGFKREVIGMSTSICREPDLGIIFDKYGFKSPESRGVLTIFVIGSVIGTVFISFLSSISASVIPFHPYAFAMASGVGSASMNAAAITPLMHLYPAMADTLEAFAGCSNLLSFCFGIYMVIFMAIPLAELLYKWLYPILGRKDDDEDEEYSEEYSEPQKPIENTNENEGKIINLDLSPGSALSWGKLKRWFVLLLIFSIIVAIGNAVGLQKSVLNGFIGMLILSIITIIGLALERIISWDIPALLYISIIGIILAIPGMPTAETVYYFVSSLEISSICTAFLAYVGIAIGNDWDKFKKIGWRGIIITMVVIAGTYYCSATIAQISLMLTHVI
ncbi:MAG: DUF3100 domain-containing protein [archaeon]|nr:DUF3100 domain-containing protein [archaeon]